MCEILVCEMIVVLIQVFVRMESVGIVLEQIIRIYGDRYWKGRQGTTDDRQPSLDTIARSTPSFTRFAFRHMQVMSKYDQPKHAL